LETRENRPARVRRPATRVWVANRQRKHPVNRERTERVGAFVLEAMGQEGAELSVTFVSDRRIARLNRTYLAKNRATDVLAFSQREGEGGGVQPHVLGDVIISTETAAAQAADCGETLERELDMLLVHGILHLLGFEHTLGRGEAQRMMRRQDRLLRQVRDRFSCEPRESKVE